jgi:hypothetical protein
MQRHQQQSQRSVLQQQAAHVHSVNSTCCSYHRGSTDQVKVWLGEDLDHYYILSRFLICRMLTVTRIPYIKVGRHMT